MGRYLLTFVFTLLLAQMVWTPVLAQRFECTSMSPDAPAVISEWLDQAQAAIGEGKYEEAAESTNIGSSVIRFGMGGQFVDFECAGTEIRTRLFRIRQQAYRPMGQRAEQAAAVNAGAFRRGVRHYLPGRNLADVQRTLMNVQNPKLASWAGPSLRKIIERMNQSIENGHGLIPEEEETMTVYTGLLNELLELSKQKATTLLEQEEGTVNGSITEFETDMDNTMAMTDAVTSGFLGIDSPIPGDSESRLIVSRATRSLVALDRGLAWVDWVAPDAPQALRSRALKRGEALSERAAAADSLEIKDEFYSMAISYFDFAQAAQKLADANASRDKFQPQLESERRDREQRLQQKALELKNSAEEFKQSVQKTPEEQKTFKNEADSLEAELGF